MYRASRKIKTAHGTIITPFFMPDATRASVRGVAREHILAAGISEMVVNTYHLMLQPGMDVIRRVGGVHALMGWERPLLSDSGGYQVYSLIHKNARLGAIVEEGARFRSVVDGSQHLLTPEKSISIQADLGVDMMVVLDDPRPNTASYDDIAAAVERTIRWAARCRRAYAAQARTRGWTQQTRPKLFAVIQGGPYAELRARCAQGLIDVAQRIDDGFGNMHWDGMGFGGRHIDAQGNLMEDALAQTASLIPKTSLAFALGIGTPEDIVRCVRMGWEMFDCVIPTREGRHGRAFLWAHDARERIAQFLTTGTYTPFYNYVNVRTATHRTDMRTLRVPTQRGETTYTYAYVHHLLKVNDPLGSAILARHNLAFYAQLMHMLRAAVV